MKPQLAICNIFDQDTAQLAAFATRHGFSAIDWSIDPDQSEAEFLQLMKQLAGFQVRFHCRFFGVDLAYADQRGDESLLLFKRIVQRIALAGGTHMTIHTGLGNPSGDGVTLQRAIDNLTLLVEHGNRHGVSVALENLTTPLTNDPAQFNRIIAESGAFVTIDIGHAHAVRETYTSGSIYDEYILPNCDRLLNAHIYHTEVEIGHLAPECLWDLFSRLETLSLAGACDWWVIELQNPGEILRTREYLQSYLNSCYPPLPALERSTPQPMIAA